MKPYALLVILGSLAISLTATAEVKRRTFAGYEFTLVTNAPELGEAWRDEAGLTWGDILTDASGHHLLLFQSEAASECEKIGARLPTKQEFERLALYMRTGKASYCPQILPNLNVAGYRYWSSTTKGIFAYYLYSLGGGIETWYANEYKSIYARCVRD